MPKRLIAGLVTALSLLAATVVADEPITVPMPIRNGCLPFVQVKLAGQPEPYWFVVDTGASISVVSSKIASTLGVAWTQGTIPVDGATGATSPIKAWAHLDYELGGRRFEKVATLVVDLEQASQVLGVEFGGALGVSFLNRDVMTLDYGAETLRIGGPALGSVNDRTVLRVRRMQDGLLLVPLWYGDNQAAPALMDTGSAGDLGVPRALLNRGIPLTQEIVVTGRTYGLGKVVETRDGRMDMDFTFGSTLLRRPTFSVEEDPNAQTFRLGGKVLKHFALTLDLQFHRIGLAPTNETPVELPPIRSHGVGFLRVDGAWRVSYVLDGFPEASELKRGDRVVEVNGVKAADLHVEWRLRHANETLNLVVEREGATIQAALPAVIKVK